MDIKKRYETEIAAFGKKLKALREKTGLNQFELGLDSGINRTEISRIENGQKNIEFMTIVKLAEALNVEIINLFDFNEDLPVNQEKPKSISGKTTSRKPKKKKK